MVSPANSQPVDELLIPVFVGRLDVVEQAAPLAHQLEQPAPRMVVLGMRLEVIGQIGDPLGQDRDLDLRRTGISRLGRIFLNELLLAHSANRHQLILLSRGLNMAGPGCRPARSALKTARSKAARAQWLQYRDYRARNQRNLLPPRLAPTPISPAD